MLFRNRMSMPVMPSEIRRGRSEWAWALAMLLAVGCGKEEGGATVSGHVSYRGKPFAKGHITFVPRGAPAASAWIQDDGAYQLLGPNSSERIAPTAYDVVLMADQGSNKDPDEVRARRGFDLPASVMNLTTTPLHFDVVEGPNTINIDLDKLPPKKKPGSR
jgi:hypothetical protein